MMFLRLRIRFLGSALCNISIHCILIINLMTMASADEGVRPKVLIIPNDIPQHALDLLKTKCDYTLMKSNWPTKAEVLEIINGHDATFGLYPIDNDLLQAAGSQLKIVSSTKSGFDHLDVTEMKKRGIKIGYAPKIQSEAVAEFAIMLLLSAARRIHEGRLQIEQGKVEVGLSWMLGHDLRNKTVGIAGLGNIGVEVVRRLKTFGVKRFVYTAHSRKIIGDELDAEFVSFDELLKQSDFIVNCLPRNVETEKIFNDRAFSKMKKTLVFVNIGRGETVDTEALVKALKSGTIFAAGLDVTDPEPLPIDHELLKLPNAILTPHIGAASIETRTHAAIIGVHNILNFFEGKPLLYEL